MQQTRIYVVMNGAERRLVDATSAAQAIRHCVKNKYSAKPATPKEIAQFMITGMVVEQAIEAVLIPTQSQSASAQNTNSQTY